MKKQKPPGNGEGYSPQGEQLGALCSAVRQLSGETATKEKRTKNGAQAKWEQTTSS